MHENMPGFCKYAHFFDICTVPLKDICMHGFPFVWVEMQVGLDCFLIGPEAHYKMHLPAVEGISHILLPFQHD